MPGKNILSGATQADADLCNIVDPPTIGVHAGGGVHVAIPGDWQTRIAAAQQVPGCTYYSPIAGTLPVSAFCVAQLALPAVVNALTAPQQTQAAALNVKLSTAQVVA